MAKGDSAINSRGPRVKQAQGPVSRRPRDLNVFGTDDEIQNRDPSGLYTEFLPNTNAPTFQQIKPESSSGRSINRAGYQRKGGDFKFSSGPGKP